MRYLRLFSANVKIAGKFIGDIEFAPITVFCGSNASGKTMLLNFIFQNLFNEYFDDNFESNNFKKFLEKDDVYSCQAKERVQDDINHFKEGFYEKKSSITHVSICYGGWNARRMRFRQWQQQGRVQHRDWISGRGKFFRRDSR